MIFIPGNAISKKNHKVISRFAYGKNKGKPFLRNTDTYLNWAEETKYYINLNRTNFKKQLADLPKPYILGIHFVRKTKQAFDFNNLSQGIMDVLVSQQILSDDNLDEVFPIPIIKNGRFYSVNKLMPGIYLQFISHQKYPYVL